MHVNQTLSRTLPATLSAACHTTSNLPQPPEDEPNPHVLNADIMMVMINKGEYFCAK